MFTYEDHNLRYWPAIFAKYLISIANEFNFLGKENDIHRDKDKVPTQGDNPNREGDDTNREGDNPDREGDNPDREGDNPNREGDNPDREGDNPDREVDNPNREGDNPNREGSHFLTQGSKFLREDLTQISGWEKGSLVWAFPPVDLLARFAWFEEKSRFPQRR